MFQTEEQDKTLEEELSEIEINNLPDKEFKVIIIKMLKKFGRRMDEHSEKLEVSNKELENIKMNQIHLNNTINEILKIH